MTKSLLTIIFVFTNAFAVPLKSQKISVNPGQAIINPTGTSVGTFLLAYKDYSDIRIDSDLDGKVDYWAVKKGNLQVITRYVNGKISYIQMKKYASHEVTEAIYSVANDGRLHLETAKRRHAILMNGEAETISIESFAKNCQQKEATEKSLSDLAGALNRQQLAKAIDGYFDDSCTPYIEQLEKPLQDLLEEEIHGEGNFNRQISKCIVDKEKDLNLSADNGLSAKVISANFRKQAAAMALGDKSFIGAIKCDEKSDSGTTATHEEGGGITFHFSRGSSAQNQSIDTLFEHELLHRADVKNEDLVKNITSACPLKKNSEIKIKTDIQSVNQSMFGTNKDAQNAADKAAAEKSANTNIASEAQQALAKFDKTNLVTSIASSPALIKDAENAVKEAGGENINLANEIATASPLPSGETLAQTTIQKTPEGISDAVNNSYSQGAPVLRMANQVMGTMNTPAIADTTAESSSDSYGSNSDSYVGASNTASSQNSSSSARTTSPSRTIASTGDTRFTNITSRNTLKADEKVVEQIDLTNANSAVAPIRATTSDGGASPTASATTAPGNSAMAKRAASVSRRPASSGGGSDLAAAGVSNPTVGSLSSGIASADSSGPSAQAQARTATSGRKAASTVSSGTPSNSSSTGASKDEVVTFISNANYGTSKNKLKDPTFVNTLKVNKVTIVDLYGNSYGADKGDVIFLDEGNRFVRQK